MSDLQFEQLLRDGDVDKALALVKERLTKAQQSNDDAQLVEALVDEARAQWAKGDRDDAVITVDEAIGLARRTFGPLDKRVAEIFELGAEVAADADMPHSAEARFETALDILSKLGVTGYPLAHVLYHHGLFRRAQQDAEGAVRAMISALDLVENAHDIESKSLCATILTSLSDFALVSGRYEDARALAGRALQKWLDLKQARRFEVADAMVVVGTAALIDNDFETAVEFIEPACDIYRGCRVDVKEKFATAQARLGDALAALGKKKEAHQAYESALGLYREGDPIRLAIEEKLIDLARSQ